VAHPEATEQGDPTCQCDAPKDRNPAGSEAHRGIGIATKPVSRSRTLSSYPIPSASLPALPLAGAPRLRPRRALQVTAPYP